MANMGSKKGKGASVPRAKEQGALQQATLPGTGVAGAARWGVRDAGAGRPAASGRGARGTPRRRSGPHGTQPTHLQRVGGEHDQQRHRHLKLGVLVEHQGREGDAELAQKNDKHPAELVPGRSTNLTRRATPLRNNAHTAHHTAGARVHACSPSKIAPGRRASAASRTTAPATPRTSNTSRV